MSLISSFPLMLLLYSNCIGDQTRTIFMIMPQVPHTTTNVSLTGILITPVIIGTLLFSFNTYT